MIEDYLIELESQEAYNDMRELRRMQNACLAVIGHKLYEQFPSLILYRDCETTHYFHMNDIRKDSLNIVGKSSKRFLFDDKKLQQVIDMLIEKYNVNIRKINTIKCGGYNLSISDDLTKPLYTMLMMEGEDVCYI